MNINSKLLLCVSLFLLFLNPEETFAKNDTKIFRGGLERTGVYQVKVIEEGKKYLPPSADIIRSAPIYHNNNIYYGSNDHFLYSVNLIPGEFNWKFETGGAILASPALLNGTLYFGSSDRALYAIDEKTGKERWYFETNGAITTSPLVTAGTVFFGSGDGFVYAISTKTGSLIWKFPTNSPVNSSPSIFEDILYVGNNDGQLYAVDIKNGKGVWSFKTNGTIEATPVVTEEMVFVGSHDHYFYAIDRKTGQKRWGYKSFGSIFSAAAIFQDTIFFGSEDTRIYAMDISNGNVKWQLPAKDSITYAPIVVNGFLYAYSTDWYVYIIEPSNGKLLKTIYNGGPSSIPPTIGGSYLFTSDGPAYRMIVRNITKINGAEDCETKTSVFTDGKGNNRTKKLGGNYAAIKLDSLNAEDLLRINPVSGTFKYVTLHARYSGGYWKTIYKGANTSFPVAKYLSSYKKDKKCTHVIISVNGAHEKYEPIACKADILVCEKPLRSPE